MRALVIEDEPLHRNVVVDGSDDLHALHLKVAIPAETDHLLFRRSQLASDGGGDAVSHRSE